MPPAETKQRQGVLHHEVTIMSGKYVDAWYALVPKSSFIGPNGSLLCYSCRKFTVAHLPRGEQFAVTWATATLCSLILISNPSITFGFSAIAIQ